MNWIQIILGVAAAVSPVSAVVFGVVLFNQRKRQAEIDIKLSESRVELTQEEKAKLANEAAAINQERELKREGWFQEQIAALRQELKETRLISDERWIRLSRLERLVNVHSEWDWRAVRLFREHNIPIEDPPSLMYLRD